MSAVSCILLGYLFGTVNPAYLFSKAKGFDIREHGSGNAGASNVVIVLGKLRGGLCAVLDVLKAFLAYKLAKALFSSLHIAGILAGVSCILGHIFPVWMNFRGGKGLACLGGVILAYNWKVFLTMLVLEVVFTLIVGYISLMTISVSMVFPVVYGLQTGDMVGICGLIIVAIVVLFKHRENIERIRQGKEMRISYLWNKEKEIQRLREKYPE